ncbi:poly [ADP-ribose] polymerase tankyrase-like isoform X1 [Haliotis cracherodii]|uniref:poly [ADP-ribose] polymerase tankyrase-like isoform X1 n=1 Tax=Haliotis cracherodii TaxID=6455 RepID=UPI0039EBAC05
MIPSFVKRLSSRLSFTKQTSDKRDTTDKVDGRPSLSRQSTKELDKSDEDKSTPGRSGLQRRSTSNKTPLSKRPTIQLDREESVTKKSSRQVTFAKRKSSESDESAPTPTRKLSKKISSAGINVSLTSKPVLAGRAPSLTAKSPSVTTPTKKTAATKDPNAKTLWYIRGTYVTVRNEEGGWFLCRLRNNVYNTTKTVKIRWLSPKYAFIDNDFLLDYADEIDPGCILFNVRVTKIGKVYLLCHEDRLEADKLLKVVEDVTKGNMAADDVDSDIEEVVQIEPPEKKRKIEKKIKEVSKGKKEKTKGKKEKSTKSKKTPGEKKKREPKEKKERKRKVPKKPDELTLHPNPAVHVYRKDPFFETNQSVSFVSKYAHSKLVFRAVQMKDYKLLKKLIKDTEKIRYLSHYRSTADETTALHHAVTLKDKEAMSILYKDYFGNENSTLAKRKKHTMPEKVNVAKLETGSYNFRSLGVAFIRPIMASRGSREGNNALTKDLSDMQERKEPSSESIITHMLAVGIDFNTMKDVLKGKKDSPMDYYKYQQALVNIDIALQHGHHKLAGAIMQEIATEHPGLGKLATLHYSVLTSDKELKNCPPSQVKWGIKSVRMITPIHIAACNPNTQHLDRLLKVEPDFHISDKCNRRPIHFAAGCESTAPLEYLVGRGANMYDCDHKGDTPLHFAVRANRVKNVKYLLQEAKKSMSDDDPIFVRFGVGGLNRPNKASYTAMHMATEKDYLEIVDVLVGNGAKVDVPLNTSRFKVTPLMMAAQFGFLDTLNYLVDHEAVVQRKDRLGRTALIHAAMNGNTNILSYLLNIGCNPNLCDNSGNSPINYAAAYGWYFCVKTLLEAGADANVGNDWKTTPLSIAYMKSHFGIVSLLLSKSDVDVNFQDDQGMTLVSTAASSALYPDLYEQMVYLVKDKKADCTFVDVEGCTPLHHLARNDILLEGTQLTPMPSDEAMETSVKIAKLLVENGCDQKALDKKGMSAVMAAMRNGNVQLVEFLLKKDSPIMTDLDKEGDNILHSLCYDHMDSMKDYLAVLKCIVSKDAAQKKAFIEMAKTFCNDGSTPLLAACQQYSVCKKKLSSTDEEEDKAAGRLLWKRGRDFIKFLIDELKSDVNAIISEKHYEKEEDKPEKEEDRYQADWGKWSVAEMLADVESCEYCGLREEKEEEWPALRMILKYKPNMNTRDCEGHTALTGAVDYSKVVPAHLLVEESNADVNAYYIKEENGKKYKIWTVVIAALTANYELLTLMVNASADLNVIDERDGSRPLHAAIIKGDQADGTLKMMNILLSHGADVNVLNKTLRTPLHLAVDYNQGNMNDNFDLVLALMNKGADLTIKDVRGRIPLHYVFVKRGRHTDSSQHDPVELCRMVASKMKPAEINTKDKFGMTPLHRAAFRGANICCMYLMQMGADMNSKDNHGNTPLTMAVKGHHDGCATILIQNGACLKDPIVEVISENKRKHDDDSDEDEDADEDEAMDEDEEDEDYSDDEDDSNKRGKKKKKKKGAVKVMKAWKVKGVEDKVKKETINKTPLLEYALKNEFQGVCFMVMAKSVEESGVTFADAIEMGLKLQKYNIVLRLLATTTDVQSIRKNREHGRNLIHFLSLIARGFDDLIKKVVTQLVDKGLSLTKQDDYKCTPLLYASLNRNYGLAKFFMETPGVYSPKYTDSFDRSVMSAAFWKSSKPFDTDLTWWIHDLYMKKGTADVLIDRPLQEIIFRSEDKDPHYWKKYNSPKVSPLIIVINHNSVFFTQWLLKKGVNVNMADTQGVTPMMHAVKVNDVFIVKTLMNYNFDPEAKDDEETKKPLKEQSATKKKMHGRIFKLKRSVSKLSQLSKEDDESDEDSEESEEEEEAEEEKKKVDNKKKEYKPYKKVSKVNLNAVDMNGWTVMHHAVCPLSHGTFDNDEIVFILAKAGAKLNGRNKNGHTPLDLAINNGAFKVARMLQKLENINEKNMKLPKYQSSTVTDSMKWSTPTPSFHEDAERLVEKVGKPMDVEEEYVAKIDSNCTVFNGTLEKDEEQDMLYDVLLTKVDVNLGVYGLYNFYQIQLVHQPGKDLFILFTRWGRIGDSGQYQHTPYQVKEEAVKEFCKIFRAKTGNKWTDVKSFENKPKKYRIVHNKERRQGRTQTDIEFKNKSTMKSKLPSHIRDLVEELTNVKSLKAALSKEPMDTSLMPFGCIQRDRLLKARSLLQKISVLVDEVSDYRAINRSEDQTVEKKEKYQANCEEIAKLSSEYYQVIPQVGFAYEKIRPLDQLHDLKKQIRLVSNLLDYEVASRMLLGAMYREKEVNPLDYVYQSVGCRLQLLSEDVVESQYILRYINNSVDYAEVEAIYRVAVPGEQERMDKKNLGNHRLLWHGTGVANLLSILHRGLVIAPPDAPITGHLYGKGIYFSDTFEKSAGYCSSDSKTLFMLLAEVSLGNQKVIVSGYSENLDKRQKGFDSVHTIGKSRPDGKHDVCLPAGCVMPLGEKKYEYYYNNEYVSNYHNEFVVYDEGQACLRYLIQWRRK